MLEKEAKFVDAPKYYCYIFVVVLWVEAKVKVVSFVRVYVVDI